MVMLVGACGTPPTQDPVGRLTGVIGVYAPTSLTEIVNRLAVMFQSAHPGVKVQPTFGPDSELRQRAAAGSSTPIVISQGPVDSPSLSAGTAPVPLASNQIVIAVGVGNPKGLADLTGLARPDLRVALCAETEPCGLASAALLKAAGVSVPAAIRVPDVRAARAQVERGAADAALVYRTDTRAASAKVDTVEFVESRSAIVQYLAIAPGGRGDPPMAKVFLDFLASTAVRDAFGDAGFQSP
jgi:molybdate transport system substrate-binding protein